jgi:hypothetical protein
LINAGIPHSQPLDSFSQDPVPKFAAIEATPGFATGDAAYRKFSWLVRGKVAKALKNLSVLYYGDAGCLRLELPPLEWGLKLGVLAARAKLQSVLGPALKPKGWVSAFAFYLEKQPFTTGAADVKTSSFIDNVKTMLTYGIKTEEYSQTFSDMATAAVFKEMMVESNLFGAIMGEVSAKTWGELTTQQQKHMKMYPAMAGDPEGPQLFGGYKHLEAAYDVEYSVRAKVGPDFTFPRIEGGWDDFPSKGEQMGLDGSGPLFTGNRLDDVNDLVQVILAVTEINANINSIAYLDYCKKNMYKTPPADGNILAPFESAMKDRLGPFWEKVLKDLKKEVGNVLRDVDGLAQDVLDWTDGKSMGRYNRDKLSDRINELTTETGHLGTDVRLNTVETYIDGIAKL